MVLTKKPTPKNILILGAAGHIGQPLAEYVTREGPDIPTFACRQKHRKAENTAEQVSRGRVLAADYEDLSSLAAVVKGIEGVFVISSSGMSESVAMTNLTTVLKQDGSAAQIIGLLGIFPESNPYRVPANLGRGACPLSTRLQSGSSMKADFQSHTSTSELLLSIICGYRSSRSY
ncbi:hypothetical protein HZS61_017870 [Fusarium oxysporum f. sp. conglutinans]|uniref:NAD(P)-binding domain-containing protein n=1 Tax=Fusarium oxysporum f. sp. conglutinans TaxID=100902 RepID=A0A8H6LHT9_FUSOX|nr:hypothetical protein HZS61_017870 [Fusarium oxysporum f. sp. conglutinans]